MICTYCHGRPAPLWVRMNPEDDTTETFRFFCGAACLANYGTNQPAPSRSLLDDVLRANWRARGELQRALVSG